MIPFLPVLTGRPVESREVTERFLWDLRRIAGDMLIENYAGPHAGDQQSAWADALH